MALVERDHVDHDGGSSGDSSKVAVMGFAQQVEFGFNVTGR